jgi:hypothetical protein
MPMNAKSTQKLITKPNFTDMIICNENWIAIHMIRAKSVFNKAIYAGMSILDSSEIYMYHFIIMKTFYNRNM